ncbi:MAG: citE [Enterovirga sp.]|jgi:citrate lyase subunit beta/citryl-CoA lyase|nr:citE [Enterovirga sp.]
MRAVLLVPAQDGAGVSAALSSEARAVVLDITGGPNPAGARASALAALRRRATRRPKLFVRVSPIESDTVQDDLEAVLPGAPDGIFLPRTCGRSMIGHLGSKLAVLEAEHDLRDGRTGIIACVDTARGALSLRELSEAGPRLAGITWDEEALRADLGVPDTEAKSEPCRAVRALVVLAARAAGIAALDSRHVPARGSLQTEAERARRDGFTGKLARTTAELAVIEEVFGSGPAA